MKISPKLIDIVKRGACVLVTSLLIAIPHTGKSETKEENTSNQIKIVEDYSQDEVFNPTFKYTSHWEKTDNENEYNRTVYRFKLSDNYGVEYFENNMATIAEDFRKGNTDMFEVIDSYVETINTSKLEEVNADKTQDMIELEGSDITITIPTEREIDKGKRLIVGGTALFLGLYMSLCLAIVTRGKLRKL